MMWARFPTGTRVWHALDYPDIHRTRCGLVYAEAPASWQKYTLEEDRCWRCAEIEAQAAGAG